MDIAQDVELPSSSAGDYPGEQGGGHVTTAGVWCLPKDHDLLLSQAASSTGADVQGASSARRARK